MKISFQNAWNMSYITFRDTKIKYTKQFTNKINADYDEDDNLVGLEFVGGLTREMFNDIELTFHDEDAKGNITKCYSTKEIK